MKRASFYLALLFLSILMSFTPDWVKYTSSKDFFSISFPGKPVENEQTIPMDSEEMLVKNISANIGEKGYGITVMLYPESVKLSSDSKEDAAKVFRSSIDGGVNNLGDGKLVSEKDIVLDGYPGREFKITIMGGKGLITGRIYFVKKHIYLLQAATSIEDEGDEDIKRFINSFQLISGRD